MSQTLPTAEQIQRDWDSHPRWQGIDRPYTAQDVVRLRGTVGVEHSLARLGADKLWSSLREQPFVNALGALTGNQAMQQVRAGLKAIYLSGWQVAADANLAGEMYPDQSLYPANSVPQVVKRVNNALLRADQLHHAEGDDGIEPGLGADIVVHEECLGDRHRVGQSGCLDDDGVKPAGAAHQPFDDADQVAAHGAADAAIVHLVDFLVGFHDQVVVDADLAELVDDHGIALAVRFGEDAVEQGGLAGAEKAGEDGDRNGSSGHG